MIARKKTLQTSEEITWRIRSEQIMTRRVGFSLKTRLEKVVFGGVRDGNDDVKLDGRQK